MIRNNLLSNLQVATSLNEKEKIEVLLSEIPYFYFNILVIEGLEKENKNLIQVLFNEENSIFLNKKDLFESLMMVKINHKKFPEVVSFLKDYYSSEEGCAKDFIDKNTYIKNTKNCQIAKDLFKNSIEITGGSFSMFLNIINTNKIKHDVFLSKNPIFIEEYVEWINKLSQKINNKEMYKSVSEFKKEADEGYSKNKEKALVYKRPHDSLYCIPVVWGNYFQLLEDFIYKKEKDESLKSLFALSEKIISEIKQNPYLSAKYEKSILLQDVSLEKSNNKNKTKSRF